MSLNQFIADTLTVTDYLRNRFRKEKIYLMAHSGGTFIGLRAAARTPQVFFAYVDVAQMVRQLESERRAQEYMLGRFKQAFHRPGSGVPCPGRQDLRRPERAVGP